MPILPLGPQQCDFLSGYVQAIGDLKQHVGQSTLLIAPPFQYQKLYLRVAAHQFIAADA